MTGLETNEIFKSRDYQVIKSNDIILKTRYDFSVNEQKTLAYICSMIKPRSNKDRLGEVPFILEYEFKVLDYIRILGLDDGGRAYNDVKSILKNLRDKSVWITLDDGSETTVGWLSKVTTNKRSGKVTVRIDEDLIPHLFDLQERYLSYGLKNILCMKSQYSIRLYEIFKSYYDMKIAQTDRRSFSEKIELPKSITWSIDLDNLKKQLNVLDVKSYSNFNLFKTRVLEIAQREINDFTDIEIFFQPILKGRKTVKVQFTVVHKLALDRLSAHVKVSEYLNNKS